MIFRVNGVGAEEAFRHESGKHVIQRIPVTERNGRKQTSVVSVAVLPLPPDTHKGLIPEHELEIKFQCGGGPGGQHRNKTASVVRMRHKATGLAVIIANERCQHKNRHLAHRIISARVADLLNSKSTAGYNELRRDQLGGGNRGDKIRTYNVMESRVVDHRLGTKTSNVKEVLKGNLDLILK